MAGGIDWFRWHHGSATDPKFRLVAKKAGARVCEVLAVWACLLEAASAADDRGNPGMPDFESLDLALDLEDGTAHRVYARMCEREVIDADSGRVVAWEKRQPKRERPEDDTAAQRKRDQRARESAAQQTPFVATTEQVTPCHATSHQKTPRGEERREEPSSPASKKSARAAPPPVERPADVDEAVWRDWLALRKAKKAPVTPTVLENASTEAAAAGMSLEAFLRVWCARGSQGLQAEWLKPNERQQPVGGESPRDRAAREKVFRMTGGILGAKPYGASNDTIDITPAALG